MDEAYVGSSGRKRHIRVNELREHTAKPWLIADEDSRRIPGLEQMLTDLTNIGVLSIARKKPRSARRKLAGRHQRSACSGKFFEFAIRLRRNRLYIRQNHNAIAIGTEEESFAIDT